MPTDWSSLFSAVALGFTDSVNALLIAVLAAVGILLPRGKYRQIAPLVLFGDWLGVFLLALAVMGLFNNLQDHVRTLMEGPWFGLTLIAVGVVAGIVTWRMKPGANSATVNMMLKFLREPSLWTFLVGFLLGVIQSATSAPFYGGIIALAAGGWSDWVKYGGMLAYATIALSLPTAVGVAIAVVRSQPESAAGRAFTWARENPHTVSVVGGYIVAAVLIVLGVLHL